MILPQCLRPLVLVTALFTLAACGGVDSRSSESPSPTPVIGIPPTATPSTSPTAAPTPTVTVSPTPEPSGSPEASPETTPETSPLATPTITPTPSATPSITPSPVPTPDGALITDMRMYVFGTSLIAHEPVENPPPSDETSIPHWMYLMAEDAGFSFSADGRYGHLRDFAANLPPEPNWSFEIIDQAWGSTENDTLTFAEVDFTTVMISPINLIQWFPPTDPYFSDNPSNTTPVAETLKIIDWTLEQEPNAKIYIYESWAEFGIIGEYPPPNEDMPTYHSYIMTTWHSWWADYHDALIEARPNVDIHLIPVGSILSTALTSTELSNLTVTELYSDDAPNGTPTLYFLASLITYMATYGVTPPSDFVIDNSINAAVQTHYDDVVMTIWNTLLTYTTSEGDSRVF